jgi:Secretion system C-terminal sorting domain
MKKIYFSFILLFSILSSHAQVNTQLTNPGFEQGNFNGWTGYFAINSLGKDSALTNVLPAYYSPILNAPFSSWDTNRFCIMTSAAGVDQFMGIPITPIGFGTYVARLGNGQGYRLAQILEQSWIVNSSDTNFYFRFAALLSEPFHLAINSPYFKYELLDSIGNTILKQIDICTPPLSPGYQNNSTGSYAYSIWQTVFYNLSAYIGKAITLRFSVAGCPQAGHTAYCYLDVGTGISLGEEKINAEKFLLFPNPNDGIIYLKTSSEPITKNQIQVSDILGNVLNVKLNDLDNGFQIDLSHQSKGVYFVSVKLKDGVSVQRMVKE